MSEKTDLAGKRVLVTGGAGVIGQELVDVLRSTGAVLRVVDFVEKPRTLEGIEYFQLDLSNPRAQFLFRFEPDFVFHLAADFERSVENLLFWDSNYRNNVLASHCLLEHVTRFPTLQKIVFASSYLIYDKAQYSDTSQSGLLTESSQIDPRNLCGVAKLQTERDIEFLEKQLLGRFSSVSARIFRVYGRGSRDVVSRWVRAALAGEPLTVFSKDNRFDYIYAGDVARGLYELMVAPLATGIVNLGSGVSHTVEELAKLIQSEVRCVPILETDAVIQQEASLADISRLRELTGWAPEMSLADGIRRLKEHEQSPH